MRTIITSGGKLSEGVFTDIDTWSCAGAYCELLSLLKKESKIVLLGPLNSTITNSVKKWKFEYSTEYVKEMNDKFIVVDCSNPDVFPEFININNNLLEVWDHRYGYQNFWLENKVRIVIDEVGACATLIWEEYKLVNLDSKISKISANLLYTAILSNTLNFTASVTTQRDIDAANELIKYTDLPNEWINTYYKESEDQTLADPENAVRNDTKVINFDNKNIKITIGQIELWNSFNFISNNKVVIQKVLEGFRNDDWFLTAPSISEGKNYIYTKSSKVKDLLHKVIDAKFEGDIGFTPKIWLRKEILKKILN